MSPGVSTAGLFTLQSAIPWDKCAGTQVTPRRVTQPVYLPVVMALDMRHCWHWSCRCLKKKKDKSHLSSRHSSRYTNVSVIPLVTGLTGLKYSDWSRV